MSRTDYSPLPLPCLCRTVWAFAGRTACACRLLRPLLTSAARSTSIARCSVLTSRPGQGGRSPEVSSTAFSTQPADLPLRPLMDQHFVAEGPLVPGRSRPHIRFLFIGPCLCSTLPPDPPRGCGPCASLPFTSIWLVEDLHLLAVEHARHTFCPPFGTGRPRHRCRGRAEDRDDRDHDSKRKTSKPRHAVRLRECFVTIDDGPSRKTITVRDHERAVLPQIRWPCSQR